MPSSHTADLQLAPSVLKFSQSRSARGRRVHVLLRAAGAEMSTADRHRTAFDAQNAKYVARAVDRDDDTCSPNSPPIRPGQFIRRENMASDLRK
jgi:hypothetical protein